MSLFRRAEHQIPMSPNEMLMIGASKVFERFKNPDMTDAQQKAQLARVAMLGHLIDLEKPALSAEEGRTINELSKVVAAMDKVDLEIAQEFTDLDT